MTLTYFRCDCGHILPVTLNYARSGHPTPIFWRGHDTVDRCPECGQPLYQQYYERPATRPWWIPAAEPEEAKNHLLGDQIRQHSGSAAGASQQVPVPPFSSPAGAPPEPGPVAGGGPRIVAVEEYHA